MKEKIPNPELTKTVKLLQVTKADTPHDRFARGERLFKFPTWLKVVDYLAAGFVYFSVGAGLLSFIAVVVHLVMIILSNG